MENADFMNLRRMPTGRYARALRLMRARVKDASLPGLEERLEQALKLSEHTLALELSWSTARANVTKARGQAALIDNQIDAQLSALEGSIKAQMVGDEGAPEVEMARELHRTFFGQGVAAITQQAFEVQEGQIDAMLVRLDERFSQHVDALGLGRAVERLRRLTGEFKAELDRDRDPGVSFDQVRAARHQLHEVTCSVLIGILYHLDAGDASSAALRARILEPLLDQQERVAQAYSRHRSPTDVNPETGEEIVEGAEPGAGEAEPQPEPTMA
ncbi:hypothetical protein DL240_16445 [Lujinxingia litoralis]|uniref:Uncharacterized protein n=1 Tax=Lujinxingia litoralis TaxID=2211119 RepID=A0A328C2X2_9DELT|nr:hypothetical protein [Lujinxingia litoralis]RAL20620.1 hypothetical protein DL240_16445 [Lujinxingia litoralis]